MKAFSGSELYGFRAFNTFFLSGGAKMLAAPETASQMNNPNNPPTSINTNNAPMSHSSQHVCQALTFNESGI